MSMMTALVRFLWLALLVCAPAAARAEWREASSRHFLVYSEGNGESLRDFATKLEKFDKAMRIRLGFEDADLGPANRVTVYLVDNLTDVRRLIHANAASQIAGFYAGRAGGSIAVVPRATGARTSTDLNPATILLHEYSHHLMMQNASVAYPAWFREGFAEFNSTARFEEDGAIGFGAAANHRAWGLFAMNPLPIETMFDPGSRKLSVAEWEATIYARGWLLTHYLMFDEARKGQLTAYIKAMNEGKGSLDAAREAFGDLKVLDRELKAYLGQRRIPYMRLSPEVLTIEPIAVRTLRPGEAAIMDLRIRSDVGVTKDDAARVAHDMAKAAAAYPNDATVQAALAEAEFDAGELDAAEAAADRAIAADPKNIEALLYKARARMARAQKAGTTDAATWKEIRHLITTANRADPNDPAPLILFHRSFIGQGIAPTRNAVEGLLQAFELAPQDLGLRMNVAHQLLVDGKASEARRALAPIAYDPHGGELGQAIVQVIALLDEKGPKAALEAWDSAAKLKKEDKAD
ncbi:MAG: tetratricopeptide repeat protein [Allosphingosinicella sp.]